jgi:deoxyribonuclease I
MRALALLLIVTLSSAMASASVNQKINTHHYAYYGEDFYKNFPKNINKESLFKILNEQHNSTPGKFDQIGQNCLRNCYSHTSVGYDSARKIMFGELDLEKDRQGTFVEDVYCGKKFYFKSLDEVSRMHTEVNIEHTWPQSKFNGNFPKDMQKSDMHHLFLTDSEANSVRGNYHFGQVGESEDEMRVPDCDLSRFSRRNGEPRFTPPVEHKGNVARALFYFATRYRLGIDRAEEMILRQWHKADPVDAEEIRRHELIAKHQKVRNPFVDHPELVDKLLDL